MIRRGIVILLLLATLGAIQLYRLSYRTISLTDILNQPSEQHFQLWLGTTQFLTYAHHAGVLNSFELTHYMWRSSEDTCICVALSHGIINLGVLEDIGTANPPAESETEFSVFRYSVKNLSTRSSLPSQYGPPGPSLRAHAISFPIWLLFVVFGTYPIIAFMRGPVRSVLRARRGDCRRCGYDLSGIAIERCPECGRAFDLEQRAQAAARYLARQERAASWRDIYLTQRSRRRLARVAFVLTASLFILWPLSYVRPTFRTPWFNCRIVWGTIALFGRGNVDPADRDFSVGLDGFVSFETWLWPFNMVNTVSGWLIVPIWILALLPGVPWFFLYRPDRHRIAKRRRKEQPDFKPQTADSVVEATASTDAQPN
ncbi:MAG: hypothetical protein H6817_01865 [Phycisphaerales bacterium]|nr:hypothetical protein [Phycisphaerales bacterium]